MGLLERLGIRVAGSEDEQDAEVERHMNTIDAEAFRPAPDQLTGVSPEDLAKATSTGLDLYHKVARQLESEIDRLKVEHARTLRCIVMAEAALRADATVAHDDPQARLNLGDNVGLSRADGGLKIVTRHSAIATKD